MPPALVAAPVTTTINSADVSPTGKCVGICTRIGFLLANPAVPDLPLYVRFALRWKSVTRSSLSR